MRTISLTQGYKAIVDDEDYEYLNQYKWFAHRNGRNVYAERNSTYIKGQKRKTIGMHTEIIKPTNQEIDHINGNGLDNRRANLRVCEHKNNSKNRKLNINNTSGYKGVHKYQNKWRAEIRNDGIRIYLGVFSTRQEAAEAYAAAAKKLHRNFMGPTNE